MKCRKSKSVSKPGNGPRTRAAAPPAPDPPQGCTSTPAGDDPRAMRTPQAILMLIEQTVHNVIAETIAPEKARILIYAAQTGTATLKALIIDTKLEEIERRLNELEKR